MRLPSPYASPAVLAYGRFIFGYRNVVFPVCVAGLCLIVLARRPQQTPPWDSLFDLAGAALALIGETIRALTVGYDYIKRGGLNKQIYASKLISTGMFAHCRNPLYVGNLLMIFGILVIGLRLDGVVILGVLTTALLAAGTYVAMVAAEEDYLHGNFGEDYAAYCRNVPRWALDLSGLRRTWRDGRFNLRRVLLKEYSSVYTWSLGAVAFEVAEHAGHSGFIGDQEMLVVAALTALASVAFFVILTLKKTALLHETLV